MNSLWKVTCGGVPVSVYPTTRKCGKVTGSVNLQMASWSLELLFHAMRVWRTESDDVLLCRNRRRMRLGVRRRRSVPPIHR